MKTEVESALMHLKIRNTKDCQRPPKARREPQDRISLRASRTKNPDTLIWGFWPWDCEKINLCGFKTVFGNLLCSPRKQVQYLYFI